MQSAISIADVMGKALEEVRYNDASSHSPRSIAYGLTRLDEVTGGLDPGELVVVGGRPSMGKTAFLLNLIRNTALAQKKGVVYYSSELSAENICRILLMNETGLYTNPFRENILSEYEWATMEKSAEGFSSAPVFIDDTPGISVVELSDNVRMLKNKNQVELCLVDMVQFLRMGTRGSYQSFSDELSDIMWKLRDLGREMSIPIVVTSSLNRRLERRIDHRPMLGDLFGSSAIEEVADTVLLLYRPYYYDREYPDAHLAEIIVAKQQKGMNNTVDVAFDANRIRFCDFAYDETSSVAENTENSNLQ